MSQILRFPAPWSATLKVITAVCVVAMSAATLGVWSSPGGRHPLGQAAALLPFLILAITALFMVREYSVMPGELSVRRLLWNTRISLIPLQRVEVDPRAVAKSIRIGGNGGLFSFSGWYYNSRLGRYRMLVTDPGRSVVLHFADRRPIVVSPGDPEVFARAARVCAGLPPA